jgi:hypothetical protein
MAFAQLSQIWLATFSLDPALCRDFLRYLRALGDQFTDSPAHDPDLSEPRAAWEYLATLLREGCAWLAPAGAFERASGAPEPTAIPVLSHPR